MDLDRFSPPIGSARDSYAPPRVELPREPPQVNESTEDLNRVLRLSRRTVLGAQVQPEKKGPAPIATLNLPELATPGLEGLLLKLLAAQEKSYALGYLSMVAQSDGITNALPPFYGDVIGASSKYFPLVSNKTDNPIRVELLAELTNPGVGFKFAFSRDSSDVGKIDVLALIANGRVQSVPIILGGGQTLWVASHDTTFTLQDDDVLRIRVFDPAQLLARVAIRPPQNLLAK